MAYSLFPGCSLDASAKAYRTSLDWTLKTLGVDVTELEDWNCCGATSTHALDTPFVDALPARNLALAEAEGRDVLVACSACYHRLQRAHHALSEDPSFRQQVEALVGRPITLKHRVTNILELLASEAMLARLKASRSDRWQGVRVGCYYGCLAVRLPGAEGFDDPENPTAMDRIVEAAGGVAVDWPYKTRCCGASFSMTAPTYAEELCDDLLQMAHRCQLDLLVTGCPFCQYNLDLAQWNRTRREPRDARVQTSDIRHENSDAGREIQISSLTPIPIIFITQFIGVALGASAKQMRLDANLAGTERLREMVISKEAKERTHR